MVTGLLSSFGEIFKDTKQYFTNFDGLTNASRTVALWIAIVIVIGVIVCKLAVKKEKQPLVNKICLGVALAYILAVIILFTVCYFTEVNAEEEYFFPILYYPLLAFALVAVASALALAFKPVKWVKITAAVLTGAALVAAIICMGFHFASGDYIAPNWFESAEDVNVVGLYVSAVVLVIAIVVVTLLTDRKSKGWDSRSLAFAAVCIAMSFALSYLRLLKMPFGGSITFASMLPLMLFAYMFGTRKGVIAGLIYGCLQAIQDCYIVHPAQFVLDYLVAFSAIGLTGILKSFNVFKDKRLPQFLLGALIAGISRYIAHFLSGTFAFGSFGNWYTEYWEGFANPYVYSLIYNALYILPDLAIVLVAGAILMSSKNFVRTVEKYGDFNVKPAQPAEEAPASETAEPETADTKAAETAVATADNKAEN